MSSLLPSTVVSKEVIWDCLGFSSILSLPDVLKNFDLTEMSCTFSGMPVPGTNDTSVGSCTCVGKDKSNQTACSMVSFVQSYSLHSSELCFELYLIMAYICI